MSEFVGVDAGVVGPTEFSKRMRRNFTGGKLVGNVDRASSLSDVVSTSRGAPISFQAYV